MSVIPHHPTEIGDHELEEYQRCGSADIREKMKERRTSIMHKGEQPRTLGEYVRARRDAMGLSARKAELLSGIDMRYWHKIETDEIATPNPRYLIDIARAIDVDPGELYAIAGYAIPQQLPELMPYLRAKLDMSPRDAADLKDYMDVVLRGYFGIPADQPVFPPATHEPSANPARPAPDAKNRADHPWHGRAA